MEYDVKEIIDSLDGPAAAARKLGVRTPSVIEWKKRNTVPIERCAPIERLTGGRFKRWGMRPGDWHLIWPELVGAEGAPAAPVSSALAAESEGLTGVGRGLGAYSAGHALQSVTAEGCAHPQSSGGGDTSAAGGDGRLAA